jgi:hypothetical protein
VSATRRTKPAKAKPKGRLPAITDVMPHPPVHIPDDFEIMTDVDQDPMDHTDVETPIDSRRDSDTAVDRDIQT